MRVVLLQNIDHSIGLVNGSQGIITSFKSYIKDQLPTACNGRDNEVDDALPKDVPILVGGHARYRQEEIRRYAENLEKIKKSWPVVRFQNGVTRTIYPDCAITITGDPENSYNVVSRTQIPLIAGSALTIHRSQARLTHYI